ncbi:uncharacterized protein LOC110455492 [Mizuhopecten yessoensis]|uniref:DUF229 domain containing protein n=1 Tax=Mizuhopecten yessoensis TaxID=6573 RepID=A0A210QD06_MIZYE|nr:uncharacterized protein LOC110455492 [Mizuhopecten yessoensis]XP_021361333.1 uncharacterized protein LOC110455492 [Mizuhopecten yessoensis]XP_021361334.1 uncharacterized protein LOC110455492 [Mizuhopecten yessoensis]XP_021361335.1 uncharacterized protein LOC110455492 [Mizuhopecten yessoensis]XP_021361336.1 uncharacterized protein LOC110455492 [Mizuhopecten yessoensis]XP_021361337.1 uncharacterized protein LOC110455492 [Mizuhopecten yessoensis]XP_021361338.1 uncharacterized protein LOC11045
MTMSMCSKLVRYFKVNKKSIVVVFLVSLLLFANFRYNQPSKFRFSHTNVNGVCTLPDIDPFDEEIMKLNWHPHPVVCDDSLSFVYIDRKGFIQLNTTTLSFKQLSKSDIDCTYQQVERQGDDEVILKPEVHILEPEYINCDFVVARCRDQAGNVIYEGLLMNTDYRTVLHSKKIHNETQDQLSVLILGIDSVSRNAALRKLPKTMKYVQDVLGGLSFKGYTKVGENTFPNMVPLLTGRKADPRELSHVGQRYFDDYPLIFHNFSRAGYATLYAEDWPAFSTFNYAAKGFNAQPSDHYIRPLYLAMKNLQPVTTSLDQVLLYLEDKDIQLKYSSLCFRNRLKHHMFLEYFKRFIDVYRNKAKFAFTWINEISHDYANFLEIGDQDFVDFLTWLKKDGHLDNTVLLLMSDHGSRSDTVRNTVAGRIEVRMPLLTIVLPEHFKQQHPDLAETMIQNTKVITTPFDVYALMDDIAQKRFDNRVQLTTDGKLPRGISLFRKIPKERTCADASIHEFFCACFTSIPVNRTSRLVLQIARASITKINLMLSVVKNKCAELSLTKIEDAQLIESNFKRVEEMEEFTLRNVFFKPVKDRRKYLVLFKASPSDALFEVTASVENNEVTKLGEINRTNRYGKQSQCIVDPVLRNYCLCI